MNLLFDGVRGKSLLKAGSRGSTKPCPQSGVRGQRSQRMRGRLFVTGRRQKAFDTVAARLRGQPVTSVAWHNRAARCGFNQRARQSFGIGRKKKRNMMLAPHRGYILGVTAPRDSRQQRPLLP